MEKLFVNICLYSDFSSLIKQVETAATLDPLLPQKLALTPDIPQCVSLPGQDKNLCTSASVLPSSKGIGNLPSACLASARRSRMASGLLPLQSQV